MVRRWRARPTTPTITTIIMATMAMAVQTTTTSAFIPSPSAPRLPLSSSPSRNLDDRGDRRCSLATRRTTNHNHNIIAQLQAQKKSSIHQDDEGNCIFGTKKYWDQMYDDDLDDDANIDSADQLPSDAYSWYCGWSELQPFWEMLVPKYKQEQEHDHYESSPNSQQQQLLSRVVIAGIGNDPTPVDMYDAGYTNMMAYDYSESGVARAKELFETTATTTTTTTATTGGGEGATTKTRNRDAAELITADARDLPLDTSSVDATLDKGTLDAIYITGKDAFRDSVKEMGRVTAAGGRVISVSRVIPPEELLNEFDNDNNSLSLWENVHDGSLAFAEEGEATIDLGAELYSWKRTNVPYVS